MNSKDLLDTELLAAFQDDPPKLIVDSKNLREMREFTITMMRSFPKETRCDVRIEKYFIEREGHSLGLVVYRPAKSKSKTPAILHLHPGGFILGNAEMSESYCSKMAVDLGCVVVSVDYRLAPEHPFPAALNDAYDALKWIKDEHSALGIDPNRIIVTGESGGGGLAAQLAFLIRDRKEVVVKIIFLTYPMLDHTIGSSREPGLTMGEFFWTRQSNSFAWKQYLPNGYNEFFYPAVPSQVDDLRGLPPIYIAVGSLDLFALENVEFAAKLLEAGNSVELHVYPGACHGFEFATGTNLSDRFFNERIRVFKKYLK